MHKDTKEALERLEEELLAEEQPETAEDEDLDRLLDDFLFEEDDEPEDYRNFANGYRAYNADDADLDLDHYSDEVYEEPKKGRGELWFALVVLVLTVGIMIWWAVRLL